eukprot:NODE_640_length_1471_cov_262.574543_g481_i0.p1 GENE.NODE_640_length_1471_cov_262.574543_g481_i0~~NODE_640_length_1471_cov_262.574543_g481_i0.p1  ORF type:complete len:297 (+),score=78.02 NODE_640_length_1471_cov_262.574543_g481_i0:59-892(+)
MEQMIVDEVAAPTNPIDCGDFLPEILEALRQTQAKGFVSAMHLQAAQGRDIFEKLPVLIDWCFEVVDDSELKPATFHYAVNYILRYLALAPKIHTDNLQLLGITCLLIAAKYEEIQPPTVDDLVYLAANAYRRSQVIRMEIIVLNVLHFDLTVPTVQDFLPIYLNVIQADQQTSMLASYLVDLFSLDSASLNYCPSMICSSAIFLAHYGRQAWVWSDLLTVVTQYQPSNLRECVNDLHRTWINAHLSPQQTVREKYSSPEFLRVALECSPPPSPLPF